MNLLRKTKIVFFASGEFPVMTLEHLLTLEWIDIVGVVTSNYKNQFKNRKVKHIIDVCKDNNIDYIIPKDVNDDETYEWLKKKEANYFCVISYKKLSDRILSLAKDKAFNVHGSVLPFLRGAAPINHAIRLGFKETGLTAFILNDKIDCGEIIATETCEIKSDDNFEDLYFRLSELCVEFTERVVMTLNKHSDYNSGVKQSVPGVYSELFRAPKINEHYTDNWLMLSAESVMRLLRSISPVDGLPFDFIVNDDKHYSGKILAAHTVSIDDVVKIWKMFIYGNDYCRNGYYTDGKEHLFIVIKDTRLIEVDEIQLAGKKKMDIKSFLNGYGKIIANRENTIILTERS